VILTYRVTEKKRNTTQAAKHPLHQLKKRRHIGPPKEKKTLVWIWRVAGNHLLQTETLRAIRFFKCGLVRYRVTSSY